MNLKVLVVAIAVVLLMVGCTPKTDTELFYELQKRLNEIESYEAQVEITSMGNKEPNKYLMKQWFKKPNMYRLEALEPESIKGKITVSDGNKAWIHHPAVDQKWMMQKFSHSEEQNMFLGYFIKNCLESENTSLAKKELEREEYLLIQTDIPGNHAYYSKEVLWLNTITMKPYLLQVFDTKNQLRIEVKYLEFEYDPKLEDSLFKIAGNES